MALMRGTKLKAFQALAWNAVKRIKRVVVDEGNGQCSEADMCDLANALEAFHTPQQACGTLEVQAIWGVLSACWDSDPVVRRARLDLMQRIRDLAIQSKLPELAEIAEFSVGLFANSALVEV